MRAWPIHRRRLAALLRAFRLRSGATQDEVERRLKTLLESPSVSKIDRESLSIDLRRLESSKTVDHIELTVAGLHLLAKAYQISRLMLDPLVSDPQNSVCVIESFDEFEDIADIDPLRSSSPVPRYRIPGRSLAGTDEVALVHLDLPAGASAATHVHPGTELLLVMRGEVEVRLRQSGTWNRLGAGAYAHYYADQPHSALNLGASVDSELFIIRFYQVTSAGPRGTREEFVADLQALYDDIGKAQAAKRRSHLLARVIDELRPRLQTVLDDDVDESAPLEIVDRFGMSQLLRLICDGRFQGHEGASLQQLADRAARHNLPFSKSKIDRLHHGLAPVKATELPLLAQLYGVKPFLFVNFLYPTFRGMVAVRGNLDDMTSARHPDFKKVSNDFVSDPSATYFVPRRRLADSDMAVVLVELKPGGETPRNRHPGHELIIPLVGKIGVRFGDMTRPVGEPLRSYAHYKATIDHSTANLGDEPARFIVVRFHE